MDVSFLVGVIGILVAVTNVITEVVKKVTYEHIPTNLLATIVSVVITYAAYFLLLRHYGAAFAWVHLFPVFVVGIMVAYAAMFGFDKLKETIERVVTIDRG